MEPFCDGHDGASSGTRVDLKIVGEPLHVRESETIRTGSPVTRDDAQPGRSGIADNLQPDFARSRISQHADRELGDRRLDGVLVDGGEAEAFRKLTAAVTRRDDIRVRRQPHAIAAVPHFDADTAHRAAFQVQNPCRYAPGNFPAPAYRVSSGARKAKSLKWYGIGLVFRLEAPWE